MKILQGVSKEVVDRIKGKVSGLQNQDDTKKREELEMKFDPSNANGMSPQMQHYMDEQYDFELEEKYIEDEVRKSI